MNPKISKGAILLIGAAVSLSGIILEGHQQADLQPRLQVAESDLTRATDVVEKSSSDYARGVTQEYATWPKANRRFKTLFFRSIAIDPAYQAVFEQERFLATNSNVPETSELAQASPPALEHCGRVTEGRQYYWVRFNQPVDRVLNAEFVCQRNQLRWREITDARNVESLQRSIGLWSGVGRALQLFGIIIALAKDLIG